MAYRSFLIYRDLGPSRKLAEAARRAGKAHGTMRNLSTRWEWGERVRDWDNEQQRIRDDAILAAERKYEERRLRAMERRFQRAEILDTRAEQLSKLPVTKTVVKEETYEDGRTKTITFLLPAGWRQRDIAMMFDVATRLENEALEATRPPKREEDKQTGISDELAERFLNSQGATQDGIEPPSDDWPDGIIGDPSEA